MILPLASPIRKSTGQSSNGIFFSSILFSKAAFYGRFFLEQQVLLIKSGCKGTAFFLHNQKKMHFFVKISAFSLFLLGKLVKKRGIIAVKLFQDSAHECLPDEA
jgi:hypothetical protein